MRGQGWLCMCMYVCMYKGKAGTVLLLRELQMLQPTCSLSLFPSYTPTLFRARNTPEIGITYTGWEGCQSGCWLRAAGVCFSMAFHTLCTTLPNPRGLVPLWALLYYPSKSSPHEGKSQLAKESWRLGSTLPSGGS